MVRGGGGGGGGERGWVWVSSDVFERNGISQTRKKGKVLKITPNVQSRPYIRAVNRLQ